MDVGDVIGVRPSKAGLWDLDLWKRVIGENFLTGDPSGDDIFLTGEPIGGDPIGDFRNGVVTGDESRSILYNHIFI